MVPKTIYDKNFELICVWICTGRFAHMYVGQGGKNKQWLVYKTHNDLYTSCTLYLYTSHTACVRCLCIPCNVYSMAMYTIRGNWTRRSGITSLLESTCSLLSFIGKICNTIVFLLWGVVFCIWWQKLWFKENSVLKS